jgi:pilus assembly protein CpaE
MTIETLVRSDVTKVGAMLRSRGAADCLTRAIKGDSRLALLPIVGDRLDLVGLRALEGDVLLVEIDDADPAEIRVLEAFLSDAAAPPVIVTSPSFDVQSLRALMKIGILDIVPQPISASDLTKAIESAVARCNRPSAPDPTRKGPIISFLKAGGGVGATSLIVQGACAIAQGKRPATPAALDLDLQFGAAATLMDVEQRMSILDLVRDPRRLDGALLNAAMVRPHDRFDLLPAPEQILSTDDIDPAAVNATIALASRTYSSTLIDLPMLWNHWVHAVLEVSDVIVIVLRLTVPSLRRARAQIDMLRSEGLQNIPLFVIANAADMGFFSSSGPSLKKAEAALGRKIDFCIPKHEAMHSAADRGQPLSEISGGKSLETKLASMMEAILGLAGTTHQPKAISS